MTSDLSAAKIHPQAVVDAKAELAAGVVVGPGAVIGPDVVIGAKYLDWSEFRAGRPVASGT